MAPKNISRILAHTSMYALLCMYFLVSLPGVAYALIYSPGETLNPSCVPTDSECRVQTPIVNETTATSTFNAPIIANDTVKLTSATSTPTTTASRLYNLSGTLYWNGTELGGANATGTAGLLQFTDGAGNLTASSLLSFSTTSATLAVMGTTTAINLAVSGTATTSNLVATGQSTLATTSITGSLDVAGTASSSNLNVAGTATTTNLAVTSQTKLATTTIVGYLGVGTTSPQTTLHVEASNAGGTATSPASNVLYINNTNTGVNSSAVLINLGVASPGASNQWMEFTANGVEKGSIEGLGGAISYFSVSDKRLKTDTGKKAVGLLSLRDLPVHSYTWNSNSVEAQGFFAQELYDVYPFAVSKGSDEVDENGNLLNLWKVDYAALTPFLTQSIKDMSDLTFGTSTDALSRATSTFPEGIAPALASLADETATSTNSDGGRTFMGKFFDRMIAWFANATNGIGIFSAEKIHTKEICLDAGNGDEVCLTADDVRSLGTVVQSLGSNDVNTTESGGGTIDGVNSLTSSTSPATSTDAGSSGVAGEAVSETSTLDDSSDNTAGGSTDAEVADTVSGEQAVEEPVADVTPARVSEPALAPVSAPAATE